MTVRTTSVRHPATTDSGDEASALTAHYSITLPPGGSQYRLVQALSARLATIAGVPRRTKPHITIQMIYGPTDLADLRRLAAEVATVVPPFQITTGEVGVLASPTEPGVRYVHLTLERTPEILALYRLVTSVLRERGLQTYDYSPTSWVPHLSLVGGELSPRVRSALVAEVRRRLVPCTFSVQTLCLNRRHPDGRWTTVARFRLGRKASDRP